MILKTRVTLLLLFSLTIILQAAPADSLRYRYNTNYDLQLDMQKAYKTKRAKIVMLGNSLTHGANWNELLGRTGVVERGIPGDILQGYLNRLDQIIKLKPEYCFIMGGVNDIYGWISVDEIFQNYLMVVNTLQARGIKVVIQSTLYAAQYWGKDWLAQNNPGVDVVEYNAGRNKEVDKLNNLLRKYAKENNIEFLELNSKLSKNGFLISTYTYDQIHLNAKGYKIWAKEIDEILNQLGI